MWALGFVSSSKTYLPVIWESFISKISLLSDSYIPMLGVIIHNLSHCLRTQLDLSFWDFYETEFLILKYHCIMTVLFASCTVQIVLQMHSFYSLFTTVSVTDIYSYGTDVRCVQQEITKNNILLFKYNHMSCYPHPLSSEEKLSWHLCICRYLEHIKSSQQSVLFIITSVQSRRINIFLPR